METAVEPKIIELKNKNELSIAQIWLTLSRSLRLILPKVLETGEANYKPLAKDEKYTGMKNPVQYAHVIGEDTFTMDNDYTLFSLIYERPGNEEAKSDTPKKLLFKSSNPDVLKIEDDTLKFVYYSLADSALGNADGDFF